ncbi:hypothetical protein AAG906_022621 [Vitis piasezkii]
MDEQHYEYLHGHYARDPKQYTRSGASPLHPDWGHLYKRSFTGPYLQCLSHLEAQYVLAELHEGVCGNHSGGRSLAHRANGKDIIGPR